MQVWRGWREVKASSALRKIPIAIRAGTHDAGFPLAAVRATRSRSVGAARAAVPTRLFRCTDFGFRLGRRAAG
jgi:hypothetical protein